MANDALAAHSKQRVSALSELAGVWRRSLIRLPDGREDRTSFVRWLQGPRLFADLRQPTDRANYNSVTCLRELGLAQIESLATQQGFAGEISFDGSYFEWRHHIDFHGPSVVPDAGRLWLEKETLIEEGRDVPYVEHWHRDPSSPELCVAVKLLDTTNGQAAIIVRAGATFIYARDWRTELHGAATLSEQLRYIRTLKDAQDMIDCEISFGHISARTWSIERSTLPFKEGLNLQPVMTLNAEQALQTKDVSPDGNSIERFWTVVECDGGALTVLMGTN